MVNELKVTYAEYLEAEEKAPIKHEYLRGETYAMSGGTPEHGRIAIAIASELRIALRGRPCNVYSSDVRTKNRSLSPCGSQSMGAFRIWPR